MAYMANKEYLITGNDLVVLLPFQFFRPPVNPDGQAPQVIDKTFSTRGTLG